MTILDVEIPRKELICPVNSLATELPKYTSTSKTTKMFVKTFLSVLFFEDLICSLLSFLKIVCDLTLTPYLHGLHAGKLRAVLHNLRLFCTTPDSDARLTQGIFIQNKYI